MSVNISVKGVQFRVGRPSGLTYETQLQYFPHLQKENGWGYYTVSKTNKANQNEIHCLRIPENKCCNIVAEMQWYCHNCNTFPCQWRARQRHIKKCQPKDIQSVSYDINFDDDTLVEQLMKDFSGLDIVDFERFCNGLSEGNAPFL